jgi:flagellin
MPVINTNVNSLNAQNSLTINARLMSNAMDQLSTGKRVNGSKDDAAGVAVINTMTAQIRGLNQSVKNANDAVSLLQTADGAMIEQTNMLQRMRELAVQASTDTVTTSQKGFLQIEFADHFTQSIGTCWMIFTGQHHIQTMSLTGIKDTLIVNCNHYS